MLFNTSDKSIFDAIEHISLKAVEGFNCIIAYFEVFFRVSDGCLRSSVVEKLLVRFRTEIVTNKPYLVISFYVICRIENKIVNYVRIYL